MRDPNPLVWASNVPIAEGILEAATFIFTMVADLLVEASLSLILKDSISVLTDTPSVADSSSLPILPQEMKDMGLLAYLGARSFGPLLFSVDFEPFAAQE